MFYDSLYCFMLGKVVQIGRQLDKLIWGGDNHKFCRWTDTVPADVMSHTIYSYNTPCSDDTLNLFLSIPGDTLL